MDFPKMYIAYLYSRANIVEVIQSFVPLRARGAKGVEYAALCPFHKEKKSSFVVNYTYQFYHCFGCGQTGRVFDFLMKHQRMSFYQAVMYIAKKYTCYPKQWRSVLKKHAPVIK